jgi:aryl-alcohol dehydrogenase-like predicted oxidoreductase
MNAGVTFWDTAEIYGNGASETIVGNLVTKHKDTFSSNPPIIATKFIPLPWRLTQSSFKSALDASLTRLKVSSIDLYQIHGPFWSLRKVEVWAKCLGEAFKAGKIKAVGVSNYNMDQVR